MTEENPKTKPVIPFVGSELPEEEFGDVRDILLRRRGFDLGMYKDRCIKRRIAIRVRALGFQDAASYLSVLREDEQEVDALLAVLTIHVSQFFRNPSTYAVLEKRILPELVRQKRERGINEIRLWSVGCAGGEEPYSLAMLVDDLALEDMQVSILGTDISAPVLEQAREGLFGPHRLTEVADDVRSRYFDQEGKSLRIRRDLRRMVRFERHDILKAAGYPAADLILCRNVLIYFSRAEQEGILERFAASLPIHGFLVLGRAETLLGGVRRLFAPEYPEERIYRRI